MLHGLRTLLTTMLNGLRDKISVDTDKKVNAEQLDWTSLDLSLLSVHVCVFHSFSDPCNCLQWLSLLSFPSLPFQCSTEQAVIAESSEVALSMLNRACVKISGK